LANFRGTSHESYATGGRNFKFMKSVEMTRRVQKLGEQIAPRSVGMRSNV